MVSLTMARSVADKNEPHIHYVTERVYSSEELGTIAEVCKRVGGWDFIATSRDGGYDIKYTIDDRDPLMRETRDQIVIDKVIQQVLEQM